MPLYFITGATGSGKSTLRDALIERGYEAHDTDGKQQNLDAAKGAGLKTLLYPKLETIEESNARLFENLTKNLT